MTRGFYDEEIGNGFRSQKTWDAEKWGADGSNCHDTGWAGGSTVDTCTANQIHAVQRSRSTVIGLFVPDKLL